MTNNNSSNNNVVIPITSCDFPPGFYDFDGAVMVQGYVSCTREVWSGVDVYIFESLDGNTLLGTHVEELEGKKVTSVAEFSPGITGLLKKAFDVFIRLGYSQSIENDILTFTKACDSSCRYEVNGKTVYHRKGELFKIPLDTLTDDIIKKIDNDLLVEYGGGPDDVIRFF